MIVASLLAWFDTCIGVLKAYWCRLVRRTKEGSQEGGKDERGGGSLLSILYLVGPYLPMTWLEAHMLKNDAFPSYMHASPICYVINSAIFFRDGLPSTDEVKTVLQDKVGMHILVVLFPQLVPLSYSNTIGSPRSRIQTIEVGM